MKYLYELHYNRIMILSVRWYQNIRLNILIYIIRYQCEACYNYRRGHETWTDLLMEDTTKRHGLLGQCGLRSKGKGNDLARTCQKTWPWSAYFSFKEVHQKQRVDRKRQGNGGIYGNQHRSPCIREPQDLIKTEYLSTISCFWLIILCYTWA